MSNPGEAEFTRISVEAAGKTVDPWRVSIAAATGSFMEYYDFAVYGVLAIIIGPLFFPSSSPSAALLSALLVYAAAFVIRPVGAIVFGWIGDRQGRRSALIITIVGMGAASAAIGILPTHAKIGTAAPALLVMLRLIQGFFAGGEVSGATTYVAECAPDGRRGFFSSINVAGVIAGGAGAALTAAIIRTAVAPEAMSSWGWRIPFFLSLPLLGIGLYVRLRLADSPRFVEVEQQHRLSKLPIATVFRHHFAGVLRTLGLAFGMTVTGLFSSVYLFIYLVHVVKLPLGWASWAFAIVECVAVVMTPYVGMISDRFGRKLPVMVGFLIYFVLTPASMYVMEAHQFPVIGFMLLLLAIPHAAVQGAVYPIYPELFPTRVRYSGMAIGFNIAIIAGGGLAPYVSSKLVVLTGSPLGASLYVMFAALVAILTLSTVRDIRKETLDDI
jgi:MHS family proline/betaine transporter-like MFS transporter